MNTLSNTNLLYEGGWWFEFLKNQVKAQTSQEDVHTSTLESSGLWDRTFYAIDTYIPQILPTCEIKRHQ